MSHPTGRVRRDDGGHAWLHRITVNRCHRIAGKSPATYSLEEKEVDLPAMNQRSQPEEVLLTRIEYDRLLKALSTLDTKHRSVLVLRYFNDLSYNEIADVLEIPLGTVKSRLNQSLKYLKKQMNPGEAQA